MYCYTHVEVGQRQLTGVVWDSGSKLRAPVLTASVFLHCTVTQPAGLLVFALLKVIRGPGFAGNPPRF